MEGNVAHRLVGGKELRSLLTITPASRNPLQNAWLRDHIALLEEILEDISVTSEPNCYFLVISLLFISSQPRRNTRLQAFSPRHLDRNNIRCND
jgi:hypothetical protein